MEEGSPHETDQAKDFLAYHWQAKAALESQHDKIDDRNKPAAMTKAETDIKLEAGGDVPADTMWTTLIILSITACAAIYGIFQRTQQITQEAERNRREVKEARHQMRLAKQQEARLRKAEATRKREAEKQAKKQRRAEDQASQQLAKALEEKEFMAQRLADAEAANVSDENKCVLCLDQQPTRMFKYCSHICYCVGCAREVKKREGEKPKCPMCQRRSEIKQVYLP